MLFFIWNKRPVGQAEPGADAGDQRLEGSYKVSQRLERILQSDSETGKDLTKQVRGWKDLKK